MSERIWDDFLTEQDMAVFKASGYGTRGDWGQRPALLVIDVSYGFTGEIDEPILDSIKTWPNSCGHFAWRSVPPSTEAIDCRTRENTTDHLYHWTLSQRSMGHG